MGEQKPESIIDLEEVALEIFAAMLSRSHDHGAVAKMVHDSWELAKIWKKESSSYVEG